MARRTTGTRRLNGQGTVTQDKARRRWRAQFYDDEGQRRTLTGRTRAEVEAALRAALVLRDRGALNKPPSQVPTLGAWLTQWVEARAASVAPSTATSYRLAATRVGRHIGDKRLDKLTAADILWYQNQERARGLSEGSLVSDHRVLKRALGDAVRARLLSANPLDGVRAPKPQRQPANPLTEAECRTVLEQARADGAMAHAMRRLALLYGPRQSEILGLKWTDLDLTTGDLRIQRALRRDAGVGLHVKAPKSSESIRTLRLDPGTVAAIREWRRADQEPAGGHAVGDDGGWIFTGRCRAPLEAARDWRLWKGLSERAGVRHVRLHDARHAAGTLINATETDPRTIRWIFGRADVHTTLTYYVKPTESAASSTRGSSMSSFSSWRLTPLA